MSRILRRNNDTPAKETTLGVIGKIKIGQKTEKGYPTSLDYFRCDAPEQYRNLFLNALGEKPTQITVLFPSDDMEQVCKNYYELRGSDGKRIAYGDGVHFQVATKQGDGTVKDVFTVPNIPQNWMDTQAEKHKSAWKEVLILRFLIPSIPVMGIWEFRTQGDDSTIPGIVGSVDTIMRMAGRIAMIPFDLTVKMVKSDKAGSTSKYPVVSLSANLSQNSIEQIQNLPVGVTRVLSETAIQGMATGTKAIEQQKAEPGYDSFEVLSSPETLAAEFIGNYIINTLADLNDALIGLKKSELSNDIKKAAWVILKEYAKKLEMTFDEIDKVFIKAPVVPV